MKSAHSILSTVVYLEPAEEMLGAIKDINYILLASARIFSRLGVPVSTVKIDGA